MMKFLLRVAPALVPVWSSVAQAAPDPAVPAPAEPAQAEPAPAQPAPAASPTEPELVPTDPSAEPPTPLEEPAELSPPPPPTPVPVSPAFPERARQPVRAERRLAILGELGWNSLAGFGPNITFHAHPRISFDFGAGFGLVGAKIGLRTRVNLLESELTPFIGAGVIGASGLQAPSREPGSSVNPELNIKVLPSTFVQGVVGVDWTRRNGFTLVATVGHAWLLGDDNVEIVTGTPTEEERRGIKIAFGSSAVIALALGYSFR